MNTGMRVVVVEDDVQMMRFLKTGLEAHGFLATEARNLREGLAAIVTERPDLILLDLALPDGDGMTIIDEVRAWSRIPILVLSSRTATAEKISALDGGANDYVTKPFDMGELLARMRAALRHGGQEKRSEEVIVTGPLRIDVIRRTVTLHGEDLHLSPREYDLLKILAVNAGMVLTHSMLLSMVWGDDQIESTYLRIFISRLRHKIEEDPARPRLLVTETGIGYRLKLLAPD
jgi:two-component system KDP operon response regulator KdpE